MSLSAWKDILDKSIFMPFSLGIYLSCLKVTPDVWNMGFMPMFAPPRVHPNCVYAGIQMQTFFSAPSWKIK